MWTIFKLEKEIKEKHPYTVQKDDGVPVKKRVEQEEMNGKMKEVKKVNLVNSWPKESSSELNVQRLNNF